MRKNYDDTDTEVGINWTLMAVVVLSLIGPFIGALGVWSLRFAEGRESVANDLCGYHNAKMVSHDDLETITCKVDAEMGVTFILVNKHNASWQKIDR